MVRCPVCGSEQSDWAGRCSDCGAGLEDAAAVIPAAGIGDRRSLRARLGAARELLRGTAPFSGLAVALVLVSAAFVYTTAMSPEHVYWTGRAVHAAERGGIVTYTYDRQQYSVDDSGSDRSGSATVYVDPHDPSSGVIYDPVRWWTDVVLVGGPAVVAVVLLGIGVARKRRRARGRRVHRGDRFGSGLGEDTVEYLLARQRGRHARRT